MGSSDRLLRADVAFRADRVVATSGPCVITPDSPIPRAEREEWSRQNHGRRLSGGPHVALIRVDEDDDPVVFMTDAEWRDHRRVLNVAHGRVVVTGLGLGCVVRAMLSIGRVTHVTIVERDPDVIKLVWPRLEERCGADRVSLHVADALTDPIPPGRWDLAWHDIWPTITAMNIRDMLTLRRRYDAVARRQMCWMEGLCWSDLLANARRRLIETMRRNRSWLDSERVSEASF